MENEKTIKITQKTLTLLNKVCSLALQTGKLESAYIVTELQADISKAIQESDLLKEEPVKSIAVMDGEKKENIEEKK